MRIMRQNLVRSLLALVILCTLVTMVASTAGAVQVINVTPSSGPVGTPVTIAANGFTPGAILSVYFGGTPVTTIPAQVMVDIDGRAAFGITVPAGANPGVNTVVVTDGALAATTAFTVQPSVIVTPSPATASDVAAYKIQFNTGAAGALAQDVGSITITFPSDTILPASIWQGWATVNGTACTSAPAVTTATRTITMVTPVAVGNSAAVTVVFSQVAGIKNPSIARTTYTVQVYTSQEPTPVNSTAYSIIPSLAISPVTRPRGTSVTVTGKGWAPNQSVTIGGSLAGLGTALADGTFSVTAVAVTSGAVTCRDGSGWGSPSSGAPNIWPMYEPTFTLKPRIAVTPTSGGVGTSVLIQGFDFTMSGSIPANNICLAGIAWGPTTNLPLSTIDSYGVLDDFAITLEVPPTISPGAMQVWAMDSGSESATAVFVVLAPMITISPASGPKGSTFQLTGVNFTPGYKVKVKIGITNEIYGTNIIGTQKVSSDGSISWTCRVKMPPFAIGINDVIVTDDYGKTARAYFTLTLK